MPLVAEVDTDNTTIIVEYDLEWVLEVMRVASRSMVPFTFFTENPPPKVHAPREYARAHHTSFTIGLPSTMFKSPTPQVSNDSSAGGRPPATDIGTVYALCGLLGSEGRRVPLSDISIISKRALCAMVPRGSLTNLNLMGGDGLLANSPQGLPWPVRGYPMLCIMGRVPNGERFPRDQSEWRAVQCVFGAVLTREIRRLEIGLEVVSREGFGSLFPTLADLSLSDQPSGIRLDPGLLPADQRGVEAITNAVQLIDALITLNPTMPESIGKLGGYNEDALRQVDNLMSWLHDFTQSNRTANASAYKTRLESFTGKGGKLPLPMIGGGCAYPIPNAVDFGNPKKARIVQRREYVEDDSGYGSDSDYEDDDPPPPPPKKEEDPPIILPGKFVLKKYSVVSGMAALRMATLYGIAYSVWLILKGGLAGLSVPEPNFEKGVKKWAPYFELDAKSLFAMLPSSTLAGVRVLLFDAAPNPVNIPQVSDYQPQDGFAAIVIDATNITSREKSEYLLGLEPLLAKPEDPNGAGGIFILVDSVSKHPTGGDLVHGVMRVYGSRKSLKCFDAGFMKPHLELFTEKGTAKDQTTLSIDETYARREMIAARMITRNKDIAQWLVKK